MKDRETRKVGASAQPVTKKQAKATLVKKLETLKLRNPWHTPLTPEVVQAIGDYYIKYVVGVPDQANVSPRKSMAALFQQTLHSTKHIDAASILQNFKLDKGARSQLPERQCWTALAECFLSLVSFGELSELITDALKFGFGDRHSSLERYYGGQARDFGQIMAAIHGLIFSIKCTFFVIAETDKPMLAEAGTDAEKTNIRCRKITQGGVNILFTKEESDGKWYVCGRNNSPPYNYLKNEVTKEGDKTTLVTIQKKALCQYITDTDDLIRLTKIATDNSIYLYSPPPPLPSELYKLNRLKAVTQAPRGSQLEMDLPTGSPERSICVSPSAFH